MDFPKMRWFDRDNQKNLLLVPKHTSVLDVMQQMSQAQASCALILEQAKLVGIFTVNNVVKKIFNTLAATTVAELMSQPVISLSHRDAENLSTVVQLFRQHDIDHLPILDNHGQVISVVTWREVIEGLYQTIETKTAELAQAASQKEVSYQASQTRFKDILDSAIATSIVNFRLFFNRESQYEYQSPGCETIFGYTSQEILSNKNLWMSRVHPEDKEKVIMPLIEELLAERTATVEYRFQHKDGSWRWISGTYTSRYDAVDNCWMVTGTANDISDRKRIEEALRHSEERWQLAIAGTNEAIWDWNITTNQTFRSDRWYEMLGYERDELSNLDDEWSIRIHPDDYEQVIAAQQAYLQRQVPDYNVEYRLCRKDGSYGWFRSRAKAVWDEQGNPVRLVGSLADITERKQMETALKASEAQYRLLFESNPSPMCIFNLESHRFLAVNRAATKKYGYSEAEFLSMTVRDIRPPEGVSDFLQIMSDPSLLTDSIYIGETKHCLRDGTVIDVEINSHFIIWAGKPARFALIKDISEQKQAEMALQEREAMLRRIGDNLPNGAIYKVIRDRDDSMYFSYLSAGIEKLMEVKVEDALRDSSLLYSQVIAEDSPHLQLAMDESFRNLSVFDRQQRIRTPSGQLKWLHFRSTPRQLPDGRVAWDGLMVDVTNLKQTEETLRKSEALLAESQRVARLGSWEFDMDSKKVTWSKELFYLFNRDPAQGEPTDEESFQFYHPEDREKLHQVVERAIATGESYKLILRVLQPDSSFRYFEAIGHVECNAEGQIIRLYGTAQDVTERQQAEERISQSQAQLATAQQIAHVGSWELNLQTHERHWSAETFRIFGLDPHQSEPTTAEFFQMIHSEDRVALQTQQQQAIAHNKPFNLEYRIIRPDGSIRHVESRAELIHDSQGQLIKFLGAIIDITERKQTELEITKSRDLREVIYNESTDALFLVDAETLLNTDCNDRAVELFQASSKAELLGINGKILQKRDFTAEESAAIIAEIEQQGFWCREIEYLTKQGNSFWGNIAVKQIAVADQVTILVRITDITARKQSEADRQRAEAALAKSEEQLRLTLEFNAIGIWDWNMQTQEVIWNDNHYRLLGLEPGVSSASYQLWRDSVHPEDGERVEQSLFNALAQHINYEAEFRVIYPDGTVRWLIGKGRGIYNQAGNPVRMLGVIIDISDRIESQEKLRQAELRYRTLIEQIPGVVYTSPITATTEFTYISPQIEKMLKIPRDQWNAGLFNSWLDYVHPEDRDRVIQSVQDAIATGESVNNEYRLFTAEDDIIWVKDQASLVLAPDGKTPILQGVAFDISDRKIAEQTLQEQENFLRSIYHGVGQSIFVVDVLDNDFRFVSVNPVHEHITGFCSDNVQGKTPEDFLPANAAAVVRQHYQDCIDAGTTITYEECLPFKGKEETWWITTLTPLKDANLRTYRIVGSSINITEHKSAQKMLELQAVITRSIAEGICLIRANDGIIVYANPKFEQMFGYGAGELTDRHISIINYAGDRISAKAVNEAITSAVLQHGEASYEVHNIKKDGTPLWCSATTSVFEHPEYGTVLVCVQQDITEHKEAEEKVKASLKEKEVLLKEIHHRVKNNLGIVSSLLQMQCRRTQDSQAAAILRDSQNRIASIALVHEKLYRSDDLANINFSQYIPELTTNLFNSYNINYGSVKLNTQVDNVSLDIESAIPCGLIINELVSNALKYAFPNNRQGEIQLRLYQESELAIENQHQSTLILIIRDNGIGLPEDFDSSKTKTLGITLVYGLVKQLRGSIEINSYQGTEFKITFKKSRT
ncbi:PAS domain-containing protein [Calothrix sp. NIES-2098]|uniref:PAS domain-containing protein n=1 Tax=Calothrix sp. NIES-2098 TaxID=1954171 RepID=UPI000B6200D9|nr:signal transduction histidine kinase [Calothrix sp. NIES-2098]